jgi:SPP1 family predicted phage head-tail adaptor
MNAGDLDRAIRIERATVVQNEFGEEIQTWRTVAECRAQVVPLRGAERFQSRQEFATAETHFRIRYRSGIKPTDRIVYDGQTYDITDIREIGRRVGLDIMATLKNPDGS